MTPDQSAKLDAIFNTVVGEIGGPPGLAQLVKEIHGTLFGIAFAVPPLLDRIKKVVEDVVKKP